MPMRVATYELACVVIMSLLLFADCAFVIRMQKHSSNCILIMCYFVIFFFFFCKKKKEVVSCCCSFTSVVVKVVFTRKVRVVFAKDNGQSRPVYYTQDCRKEAV